MVCKHCGKECPEGIKYCIFCGKILGGPEKEFLGEDPDTAEEGTTVKPDYKEIVKYLNPEKIDSKIDYTSQELKDPDKEFMGEKFATTEECNTVKQDYKELIKDFESDEINYTLQELENALTKCKQGNYHPVASQLAIKYLEPKVEELQYQVRKNSRGKKVRILALVYILLATVIVCTQPIVRVKGTSCTLLDMVMLLVPGSLELATWIWNILVTAMVVYSIIMSLRLCFRKNDIDWAASSPIIIPALFLCALLLTVIPSLLLGVNYNFNESFTSLIVMGAIWWLVCVVLMPSKPKKS